ncbi:MAG TPA: carboxypeptidase-like regulatory domain-containing protein [Gaiellales bacterium]|nr:carboxypeptidase-like regulatory domain-containing protein [Gaiellales bacterium]
MRLQPLAPMLVFAALATAGCGQAAGSGSGTQPGPAATISGRVVTFHSGGPPQTAPLPHAKVRAFTRAFPLGPVMADPPLPVATAITGADGRFTLSGLRPRRYFLVTGTTGKWVSLVPSGTPPVTLRICRNCMVPLVESLAAPSGP